MFCMAENCGRADLCGVGLKSIAANLSAWQAPPWICRGLPAPRAANLGVASPAVDLPWIVVRPRERRKRARTR